METFPPPIKLEPLTRNSPSSKGVSPKRQPMAKNSLKALREHNGVTLEEIAENTCIPIRHLADLEAGDVSNWPAGVYAKSWAREYATEAGIDPDRVIALVAPVAEVEPTIDEIKQVREERDRMVVDGGRVPLTPMVLLMRKIAAIAVVLTLIALAALYFWQGSRPDADDPAPAATGTSGTLPGQSPR